MLFGVRGSMRTLKPGRTQVNLLATRKREHSRKPDEIYDLVEGCSPDRILSCLQDLAVQVGRNGAMKTWRRTHFTVLPNERRISILNCDFLRVPGGMRGNFANTGYSRSSGLPAAWGHARDGRYIMAVYEELDQVTILPVTAYEVHEPH